VLPRHRAAVFVHGCFWHRHEGCKIASTPKSNTVFWLDKFQKNVERDARSVRDVRTLGWRIFVIWECTLGSKRKVAEVAEALNRKICAESDESP
jgi:DNA mismatch endonuclease, patch repair protein